jgi:hypothetical protein
MSILRFETRCAKFASLLLEALHLDDLGDQHVIGLTDGLSGDVRQPREPPIRDRVQRPADEVAIPRLRRSKSSASSGERS